MEKILIANRGEIAVRIIRTARELGFRTVAVYSEADADALHVAQADQAVWIGPAAVGESYLVIDPIIAAARKTGADAIHPGYGFLSENAAFARACVEAGLVFIGPGPAAIELMGSKRRAKLAMLEAGVPCVPGYQHADQNDATLLAQARAIGFPLMVKASAGGGGRGLRLVGNPDELAAQLETARSEAKSAFGGDELILERALIAPRHIEIQVFADQHGKVIHLGERDCSIQRRHQKIVEEAPSPLVDAALREVMGAAAVAAAKSCDYVGAGTVEFLVDAQRNFYFLEMNTRLQVEHPVTEMVTGIDLVAWQLLVAAGEPLPLGQDEITLTGHAVEVRLYAEDPRNGFLPQTGVVRRWQVPQRAGVRVDQGIRPGQVVSPHYDPLLAKLIGFGSTRAAALRRAASALQDTRLLGVNNNLLCLQRILRHPVVVAGQATTAFIDRDFTADPSMTAGAVPLASLARAALLFYQAGRPAAERWHSATTNDCWYVLGYQEQTWPVHLRETDQRHSISVADQILELTVQELGGGACVLVEDGVREVCHYARAGDFLFLDHGTGHFAFEDLTHRPADAAGSAGSGELVASMDGAIVQVLVTEGDTVAQGQVMVVLEAMKMEHPLEAGVAGRVASVQVEAGQQVKTRQLLARIAPSTGEGGAQS